MLLIASIVFIVGLVLELLKRGNIGVPAQIVGAVLFVIAAFSTWPVALAFGVYAAVKAVQILR